MSVKKIINSPETCVDESIRGLCSAYPWLVSLGSGRIVRHRVTNKKRITATLSGGGSGHEPFPSGYVGEGMLTASVSGSVFTSPPNRQVLDAIRSLSVDHSSVFVIIPNYTGDRFSFGLALEHAQKDGIQVDGLIVGEDIALKAYGLEGKAGARGMCGIVLILKIAGFLSEMGEDLSTIKAISEGVTKNLASIGLSLEACSLPGSTKPLFNLQSDEVEFGVGVHGEAGVTKMKLTSAKEIVAKLLKPLLEHLKIDVNDDVVALVNNLGGSSQMEQWIIADEVERQLTEKKVKLSRMYVGPMFTSLNMSGIQICLLKLVPDAREMLLKALDYPTSAPAWPGTVMPVYNKTMRFDRCPSTPRSTTLPDCSLLSTAEAELFEKCLIETANIVIVNEEVLNQLDSGCGDGDCGTTITRFAKAVQRCVAGKRFVMSHPAKVFSQLGEIAEETMGGTTGAVYGLFLTGASKEFSKKSAATSDAVTWADAWAAGIDLIKKYSVARMGDRTLLDALEPACETFLNSLETCSSGEAFARAVIAAENGCHNTQHMAAAVGRASYVDKSELNRVDAGAFGVTLLLSAINSVITGSTPEAI